ncbi:MAG TPA: response regulator [Polyangia bacterium]|nr:response regulator [Polyangia bacterium]
MIVEDDPEIRESLAELLESWQLVPVAVDGGEAALRALREGGCRPAVILLDLKMSRLSGWEFRREQMHDVRLREVPVVIMTALPIPTGSARAEFGEVAWLRKPFSLDDLQAALAAALKSP